MRANPLTPNLRAGFVITASLPASTVQFISELLAEGVVPIPLDGSTMVEGTVCTTTVSSQLMRFVASQPPDLEKQKHKSKLANRQLESTRLQNNQLFTCRQQYGRSCYASSPLTEYSLRARSGHQHLEWGCARHHSFPQTLPHLHNQVWISVLFI